MDDLRDNYNNFDSASVEMLSNAVALSHKHCLYASTRGWASLVMFFYTILMVFSPVTILVALWESYNRKSFSYILEPGICGMILGCWLALLVSWLCLKHDWVKGNLSAKLNRQKGTVIIYKSGEKNAIEKPFEEFDGFINGTASPNSGPVSYDVWLSHKQEKLWFACNLSTTKTGALLYWEFIVQYMDLTKPLPDIPELEPFRKFDETTIQWDKENKRPEEFFKNMSSEDYKALVSKVWRAVESYPAQKTREEAIASGWQPPPEQIWKL